MVSSEEFRRGIFELISPEEFNEIMGTDESKTEKLKKICAILVKRVPMLSYDQIQEMLKESETLSSKNKIILEVPDGCRYVSDIPGFEFPSGHSIINKEITGCGMTEFAIRNNENIILCSPRKILLRNKFDQHTLKGTSNLFYYNLDGRATVEINLEYIQGCLLKKFGQDLGDYEAISEDALFTITEKSEERVERDNRSKEEILREELRGHIEFCKNLGVPQKILVTYDSLEAIERLLKGIDPNLLSSYRVVVDEFQSIFTDSQFKSDVELNLLHVLKKFPTVTYVSATPMMEKYLYLLDHFKNIPIYEMIWPDELKEYVTINRKLAKSLKDEAISIIERYRSGIFDKAVLEDGTEVESKEAVFYVNSLDILKRIFDHFKKEGNPLLPKEVNILCSDNPSNVSKLNRILGNNYSIGSIPGEGEKHKMFTFCTKTVYLGADFYSTNASTFILSDPTVVTLAVDVSLDLPQILGRQRLESNPFKNTCSLIYKSPRTTSSRKEKNSNLVRSHLLTLKDFEMFMDEKRAISISILGSSFIVRDNFDEKMTFLDLRDFIQGQISERRGCTYQVDEKEYRPRKQFDLGSEMIRSQAHKDKSNFASVRHSLEEGDTNGIVEYNSLLEIADYRVWEVSQVEYMDKTKMRKVVGLPKVIVNDEFKLRLPDDLKLDELDQQIISHLTRTISNPNCRLRDLCKVLESGIPQEDVNYLRSLNILKDSFKLIDEYGIKYLSDLSFNVSRIVAISKNLDKTAASLFRDELIQHFEVGKNYTKDQIMKIFEEDIKANGKLLPSCLKHVFNTKWTSIRVNGVVTKAIRILSVLD